MLVKRLWITLAVPMFFNRVLDANGAFSAASFAIAALVFGGCWLADRIVRHTLKVVVSLFCEDFPWGMSFCGDSPCVDSPCFFCEESPWGLHFCKLSLHKVYCSISGTLKAVAFLFWLGTLRSVPCIDMASTSCVRLQISCSCCAVTNGLCFRTLARLDMAFMFLSACDRDGLVMFLCLKCTVCWIVSCCGWT